MKSWLKAQHSENEDHGIRSHHFMANRWGNSGNSDRLFFWAPKSLQMVTAAMKLKDACSLEEKHRQHIKEKPRQHIKKQRHYIANKGPSSQSYGFSSSHAWMWELDSKESWAPKNWCFWTVVLEKTLESLLDCKIKSILKEINPEYSFEGLMLKLKLQYFGHLMQWMTQWKRPWCWETLRAREEGGDRGWDGWMASPTRWTWVWVASGSWWWTGKPGVLQFVGWQKVRHNLATEQQQPEFLPGKFHGQRHLEGCSLWGHKELDTT